MYTQQITIFEKHFKDPIKLLDMMMMMATKSLLLEAYSPVYPQRK